MATMGKRGKPDIWDEVKGRICITVTPTGVRGLDAVAAQMNLSRSELIEQIGRGLLKVVPSEEAAPGEALHIKRMKL
jgi:hypothetical protein